MKKYVDPTIEVTNFEVTDITNFGGDNEVSAGVLFPDSITNW